MKRLLVFSASIVAVASFLVFEAVPQPEIQEAPVTWQLLALSDGADLYAELCAVCHGTDAKGNGPASPALAAPAPDLTQLAALNDGVYPADEVKKSITGETRVTAHGTMSMPMWGRAFQDARPDLKPGARHGIAQMRIYALTAYIETLQASGD